MIYDDLARLVGYEIPIIEVFNENGDLEYVLDLETVYFDDVDVILNENEAYGIIKLIRQNEKGKLNGKKL
jgi:hypothetical protein